LVTPNFGRLISHAPRANTPASCSNFISGHAFGLPHTDTNYYNIDRRDCLDYTIRPGNNLHPGEFNFNLLYSLYGSANGDPATSAARTQTQNGSNRRLGAPATEEDVTPDAIKVKLESVRACLEELSCAQCVDQAYFDYDGHGRMLHEDDHGEACEFDLGEGYSIQTHKLLVR